MNHVVTRDGVRIGYDIEGPAEAPALLLCHALGTTRDLWTPQAGILTRACRVIRYDARGHGQSSIPAGDYTLDDLGQDALAVLDAAHAPLAWVAGLSMGGLTAMWLGVHAPARVRGLVLANTAARLGQPAAWNERIATVRTRGLASVADTGVANWFSPAFREKEPAIVDALRQMVAGCSADGYAGCCAVLRDADLREAIARIASPALVLAGALDSRTTVADAQDLCARIPKATLAVLQAAHFSNVEQPQAFTTHIERFLLSNG